MNKKLFFLFFLVTALVTTLFIGCDDSGNSTTGPTTGGNPNIDLKAGSIFYYNTDSISQNGTIHHTAWLTKDSVVGTTTYPPSGGRTCWQINSVTNDTSIIPVQITSSTLYVSYDSQSGQLYQWGVKQLFDPNQTASWDLLADFSKALGTSVSLFTITNLFGQSFLTADVSSTVQYDTTITSNGSHVGVNCYKVAAVADIKASGLSVGKAYMDYFVGYTPSSNTSNPSGMVRIKLYPVSIPTLPGVEGADQFLNRFRIP